MAEQDTGPASCLTGPASYGVTALLRARSISYEPQIANAVTLTDPLLLIVTIALACQVLPDGAELARATLWPFP